MTLTARYLERIGFDGPIDHDLPTLTALQQAHLTAVPFENLHVFHRIGVRTDSQWSVKKIVEQGRGGWCFENNGAFAWLVDQLGFTVRRLGAAVLLLGPNQSIDHCTLEVLLDHPYLVDVGFGDSVAVPLRLGQAGPQEGHTGTYELLPSPEGTTLAEHVDGLPEARYRFRRRSRPMSDFDTVSERLQTDPESHFPKSPFATRLLDGGPDRVTLLADRLKVRRRGEWTETQVGADEWDDTLREWFGMGSPETGPGESP